LYIELAKYLDMNGLKMAFFFAKDLVDDYSRYNSIAFLGDN